MDPFFLDNNMRDVPGSVEAKLHQAAEFVKGGNKKDARFLIRDVLAHDENNAQAWELLSRASYNSQEEVFCLKRVLRLQPGNAWARQRLVSMNATPAFQSEAFFAAPAGGQAQKPKKRPRYSLPLVLSSLGALGLLCLGVLGFALFQAGFLPFSADNLTATALAMNSASCQAVIQKAMQASSQYCDQIGPNKACYGNTTLRAEMAAGATQRFSERGDVIDVSQLQRLSAAPLNFDKNQWGIAIFNIMANLPRSLPGETVKLVVFGNTTLNKNSPNLESFYFSNELGTVACQQAPSDGIMITMPNGTGVSFTINGTQMVLMGDAGLTATTNGDMQINLYNGSGMISSGGVIQYIGGGQNVHVPLGGPNGNEADGPPSAPVPLPPGGGNIYCTLNPDKCPNGNIPTPATSEAEKTIQAGMSSPSPSSTSGKSPTAAATPSPVSTKSMTPSPAVTLTRFVLPSATRSPVTTVIPTVTKIPTITRTSAPTRTGTLTPPTPTRTPTRTRTLTPTRTSTLTRTLTLTPSVTNTVTYTATLTPTRTVTLTPTLTLTRTVTLTPTLTSTRTDTATATITDTPVPTLTPTFSDTPISTATATNTSVICGNLALSGLTVAGTQLQISLTNNYAVPINIQAIDFTWDSSTGTHLKTILLGAATIWSGNAQSPQTITTFTGSTTIANGSAATLILDFSPKPAPTGTVLTISIDQGCQGQASN